MPARQGSGSVGRPFCGTKSLVPARPADPAPTSRGQGRPSLGDGRSPQLRVRVPEWLLHRVQQHAAQRHVPVSSFVREVLTHHTEPGRRERCTQRQLHREVLAHLIADRDGVTQAALANLERAYGKVRGPRATGWLDDWRRLLTDSDPASLVAVMLDDTEYAANMRQVTPFAGVLGNAERQSAIGRARAVL